MHVQAHYDSSPRDSCMSTQTNNLFACSLQVYVVCTSEHHPQVLAWAAKAGLASRCIIKDTSQASCLHLAQGIAAVVQSCPGLNSCYLLAADASYVLEPGTSLAHLVETSVVQGKDVITSIVPFEGADLSNLVLVSGTGVQRPTCQLVTVTVIRLVSSSDSFPDCEVHRPLLSMSARHLQDTALVGHI